MRAFAQKQNQPKAVMQRRVNCKTQVRRLSLTRRYRARFCAYSALLTKTSCDL